MPTQRLEAAMRPPRAVHLLLVAAVFYLRLVATQSTCCERALVERCLRASLVLEVSPVIHRRNDALRFPKNDTVRLRVHASLKGQLDRTSIFLTRGVYTDEAETQFQRNTRWFVFLQESAFGSPIFTTVGPLLPSTTDNEKQVQAAIRCGRPHREADEDRQESTREKTSDAKMPCRSLREVSSQHHMVPERQTCKAESSDRHHPAEEVGHYWGSETPLNPVRLVSYSKRSRLEVDPVRLDDAGEYECRAENKCGTATATTHVTIRKGKSSFATQTSRNPSPFEGLPCNISDYCMHGGTCTYYRAIGELACRCADGYKGQRCETKDLGQGKGCDDERGMLGGCSSQTLDVDTS
uniref:EGF-like domain-containing protein n=1 Tax=Strigamia maritima TaxID=126957 RepID=T1IM99_STRMM